MTKLPNMIGEKALKALRAGSFKFHVTHMRYVKGYGLQTMAFIRQNGLQHLIRPCGGKTIGRLIDLVEGTMKVVDVVCSKNDHYHRKLGLTLAFYKARDSKEIVPVPFEEEFLSPDERVKYISAK